MTLREYIEMNHDLKDVIYIGGIGNNSSGFIYIGTAALIPTEYYDLEVVDHYPHTVDVPGTNVLLDAELRGKYWFYGEANKRIPMPSFEINCSDEKLEGLLVGIAKQAVQDYRSYLKSKINDYLAKHENSISDEAYRKLAKRCRKHSEFTFLHDSQVGLQSMQIVEDEEFVYLRHPEILEIKIKTQEDRDKRMKLTMKYCEQLKRDRLKYVEENHIYATIKGKRVNA